MIGSSVDGREFVSTGRETLVYGSSKDAILSLAVQTLEKCEDVRVGRGCLVKRGEQLDDDV